MCQIFDTKFEKSKEIRELKSGVLNYFRGLSTENWKPKVDDEIQIWMNKEFIHQTYPQLGNILMKNQWAEGRVSNVLFDFASYS